MRLAMQMPLMKNISRSAEIIIRSLPHVCFVVPMLAIMASLALAEDVQPQYPGNSSAPSEVRQEDAKPAMAAMVNGVGIPVQEVRKLMNSMNTRSAHGAAQPQDQESLRKEALNRLIMQELAFQRAKAEGLVPTAQDIDAAMARLKTKVGGEEGYNAFLKRQGMTEKDLRQFFETNLAIERILQKEALKGIVISEDDVRKEFERDKEKYGTPERIIITDVVFFLDPKSEESVRKAEQVLKVLRDEKDMDPMKLTSDGTFIVREMEVKEENDGQLYAAAKKLNTGELSGVVIASDTLHIFRVLENTPAKQVPYESAKDAIEKKLRLQAQKRKIAEWENELKKGAKIEIMETKGSGD